MKPKHLIVFLAFLIQLHKICAQSEIGISAGFNKSGFYGKGSTPSLTPSYEHYANYKASVFYKEPITDRLFAGLELENIHVRSSIDQITEGPFTSYNALLDLNYVNIQFQYGVKFLSHKKVMISGSAGPYFGFLLYSKAVGISAQEISYTSMDSLQHPQLIRTTVLTTINETPTKAMRKANIGAFLKLVIQIPFNDKLSLLLNTSYNFGVYDVLKENNYTGIRGYTASIGFAYHLDKKYLGFSDLESQ